MIITEANISMSSNYRHVTEYTKTEQLTMWVDQPAKEQKPPAVILELSGAAQTCCLREQEVSEIEAEDKLPPKLGLIKRLVEYFTGRKIKIINLQEVKDALQGEHTELRSEPEGPSGWGLSYSSQELYAESQKLSFSAAGAIKTTDGREVSFSLGLVASRDFFVEEDVTFLAGDAKKVDPLVINYHGLAEELTDLTFGFDLDANGTDEQIHFTRPGSGFLALDRNFDGVINDGSELFGPSTGNGFVELTEYDSDNNRWIDENDSVFSQLSLWSKDSEGRDSLKSLKEAGVGAIYLDSINSRFDLKDRENLLTGQVRRLGVFLKEDGTPGSIQQIDLFL